MRLWLKHTGEVSLREQLITQVVLGILSRELAPGQRLPSTRELAHRYGIHANTASAGYRELERQGWVEFRHGSGVYIRATRPESPLAPEMAADALLGEYVARARQMGLGDALVRARVERWLKLAPPARWLVIEPDAELAGIVICELEQKLALPIETCTPQECALRHEGTLPLVLPSKAATVRALLPAAVALTTLGVRPVAPELESRLKRYMPEHAQDLVGIASRWEEFQRHARTLLIAAGIEPGCLLVRDARKAGWKRGLDATVGVVCDSVTERELPKGVFPMRFTLLDPAAIDRLKTLETELGAGSQPLQDAQFAH